jgi:hypothetical protein
VISPVTPSQPTQESPKTTKVSVNEDYLFDVEIETRELAPSYWLGPVYDVKRGTWFTPSGEPVDEGLAMQLEEGYLKCKPWRLGKSENQRSTSQPRARPVSLGAGLGEDYRNRHRTQLHRKGHSKIFAMKPLEGLTVLARAMLLLHQTILPTQHGHTGSLVHT